MFRKVFGALLLLALTSPLARAAGVPGRDAINLSQAIVYNSPADIASWPITASITQLTMQPGQSAGLSFQSAALGSWPDYTPPGWDGPLQYTVWAVVKVNGQWYTSGFIQMWRQRASTGAPILTDFARNWAYDGRWGPMQGYQPQVGEQMGFFLSAGNARGITTVTSVRERTNVVVVSLPANDTGVFNFSTRPTTSMDFDGDGRADIGIYRPSAGQWWGLASSSNFTTPAVAQWGLTTDIPVPGDYDGDRKTDVAVFRPSNGYWYILLSSTNFTSYTTYHWGVSGDIPVPGDYDGDGTTDVAVYRPGTGVWYILQSSTNATSYVGYQWGLSTDAPAPADYDGDGRTDIAVRRISNGGWYILLSSTNYTKAMGYQWGLATDISMPGDYDGDGKADIGLYRPSTGSWFILLSSTNWATYAAYQWGLPTDIPVAADFDGDGRTDIGVFRPTGGYWFILMSSRNYATSAFSSYQWGASSDLPMAKVP